MFAAVCVLLAATGHVLMSGRDLPAPALGLACAGTFAAAWALAGRERGLLGVTAVTVAVQSVLHEVFSWAQQHEAMPPSQPATAPMATAHTGAGHMATGHTGTGHMGMGHMGVSHEAMGHLLPPPEAAAHDMTTMSSSLAMPFAHLLAALLSGLWMAHGERAAFRLVRSLPLRRFPPALWPLWHLLAAVVPVPPPRPQARPAHAGDERAPRQLLLAHSVISRGPPPVSAVS
ncbi:hypothetical protein [Streptomyces laurentii]|uniref:hypothetical protein n=1 Tax=Streptomyces laurentii TaxID=39478 RepID=UPI00368F044E